MRVRNEEIQCIGENWGGSLVVRSDKEGALVSITVDSRAILLSLLSLFRWKVEEKEKERGRERSTFGWYTFVDTACRRFGALVAVDAAT